MEIHNPKRILLLSLTRTTNPHPILQHLTSTSPSTSPPETQTQEPTHHIQNPYFSAKIPIWSDTLPPDPSGWISDWTSPGSSSPTAGISAEIREVIHSIGAWVCIFQHPPRGDDLARKDVARRLRCVADVIEGADRGGGDGDGPVLVAVGVGMMGDGDGDWDWDWEEVCWDSGRWEYVDGNLDGAGVEGQGQGQREGEGNGFGELMGLARLKQVLETADWEAEVDLKVDEREDILKDDENQDDIDEGNLQAEVQRVVGLGEHGMKEPILGLSNPDEEEEEGVEDLQHMFLKLQAARDLGTSLPSSARRRLAARTVAEIMSK